MDKINFEVKEAMKFGIGFAIGTTIGHAIAYIPISIYKARKKHSKAKDEQVTFADNGRN